MTNAFNARTIIRAAHGRDNPYFMLLRAVPQDRNLSWEARGMLCYLLSQKDNWKVQPKDLQQHCGRDKVYKILNELKEAGYIHRSRIHQDDGTFKWGDYLVYEEPFTESQEMDEKQPFPEIPDTEKPYTVNPEILDSTESNNQTMAPEKPGVPGLSMYTAVEQVWGFTGSRNGSYRKMLEGQAADKRHSAGNVTPPMTPEEVIRFGAWYKREHPNLSMVSAPEKLPDYVRQFRKNTQTVAKTVEMTSYQKWVLESMQQQEAR